MEDAFQKYLQGLDQDSFAEVALERWVSGGYQLHGDMMSDILEEYNDATIDKLREEWEANQR